jgi:hypothetical protein
MEVLKANPYFKTFPMGIRNSFAKPFTRSSLMLFGGSVGVTKAIFSPWQAVSNGMRWVENPALPF